MTRAPRAALIGAALLASVSGWIAHAAPGGRPLTPATLFSQEQVEKGAELFAAKCASCHAGGLESNQYGPSLTSADFWDVWSGRPTRRLYSRIYSSMPATAPGTLTPGESLVVTGFVATGGVASGKGVTAPDALDAVPLAKPD